MYRVDPVKTWRDVMKLRRLRNECRWYMTGDTSHISIPRQILWWLRNEGSVKAFLLYSDEGEAIGFGLVRGNTVTGGVTENWRGKGVGRQIFELLTRLVPKPAYLEVLRTNKPARNLYESLGWQYSASSEVMVMVHL